MGPLQRRESCQGDRCRGDEEIRLRVLLSASVREGDLGWAGHWHGGGRVAGVDG